MNFFLLSVLYPLKFEQSLFKFWGDFFIFIYSLTAETKSPKIGLDLAVTSCEC